MASAPLADDCASDAYPGIAAAAHALALGPADWVRLETVALRLRAEGVAGDDPRVPLWFAAALCRSVEQRQAFLCECGAAEPEPEVETRIDETVAAEDEAATSDFLKRHWRRLALAGGALVLVIAAMVAVALLLPEAPDDPNGIPPPPPAGSATVEVTRTVPAQTLVTVVDWVTLAMLAAIAAAAIGYVIWQRRWLSELKRNFSPDPDHAVPLVLQHPDTRLFGSQAIRAGLRRLRRHRSQPGGRLDVRASIAATIRAGGQPQARFRGRWLMPEYLLLSEREGPRDHLAAAAAALEERIAQENVAIGHYEFLGRPDRLRGVEGGPPIPLASVLARHADARTMLLAESFDLREGPLTPAWIERVTDAGPAVHLNPRLGGGRSEAEALLAEDGVDSFPLSARGIAAMAQRLADPHGRKQVLARGGAHGDLAQQLDRERRLLLAEEAPRPMIVAGVLEDLSAQLHPDAYRWFAALALFPYLEPALTLHVGAHLKDTTGAPLLTDERYLALARLPWMRSGSMPRWLRLALAHSLDPATLASATAAIQAFLLGEADGRDPARRRLLLAWLTASPDSEWHDPILIDTIRGRGPERLGLRPAEGLARRLRVMRDNPRWRAFAAALVAGAALLLVRPPVDEVMRNSVGEEIVTYNAIETQSDQGLANPPDPGLVNPGDPGIANESIPDNASSAASSTDGGMANASVSEDPGNSDKQPQRPARNFVDQGSPIVFTFDQSDVDALPGAVVGSMHRARQSAINSGVDPKSLTVTVSFDIWVDRSIVEDYDDATYRPEITNLLRRAIAADRPKQQPSVFTLSTRGQAFASTEDERDTLRANCGGMCVIYVIRTTGSYRALPNREMEQQTAR